MLKVIFFSLSSLFLLKTNIFSSSIPFHTYKDPIVKQYIKDFKKEIAEKEKELLQVAYPKSINEESRDLFWYLKAENLNFAQIGYNYSYFKLKKVDFSIPIQLTQDEHIVVNKRMMPEIFNPKDYPGFNPVILFSSNMSLGERERIKKSLILIKIILHTDQFLKMLKLHKEIHNIEKYYEKDYNKFEKSPHELNNLKNIPLSDPEAIVQFILNTKKILYIKKSTLNTVSEKSIISADSIGNLTKRPDGIIRFHNSAKFINAYSTYMPILIFHEYLHTLGYPHTNIQESPYDFVYQISNIILLKLYNSYKFPKIPKDCFDNYSPIWGFC